MKTSTHIATGMIFAAIFGVIAGILLEQAVIGSNRKPEIRTVIQAPSLEQAQAVDDLAACRLTVKELREARPVLSHDFSAQDNRDTQSPAVSPRGYSLHPGRTPLQDPTDTAYYRQLLKEGRFPTSGSAPGRPLPGAQP